MISRLYSCLLFDIRLNELFYLGAQVVGLVLGICSTIPINGDVILAPESESEYDSRISFTPNSGTGSFALESMVPAPSQVLAPWV